MKLTERDMLVRAPDHEAAADMGWALAESQGFTVLRVRVTAACPPTLWHATAVVVDWAAMAELEAAA